MIQAQTQDRLFEFEEFSWLGLVGYSGVSGRSSNGVILELCFGPDQLDQSINRSIG